MRSKIGGRADVVGTLPPTNLEGREAVDDPTVWLAPGGPRSLSPSANLIRLGA